MSVRGFCCVRARALGMGGEGEEGSWVAVSSEELERVSWIFERAEPHEGVPEGEEEVYRRRRKRKIRQTTRTRARWRVAILMMEEKKGRPVMGVGEEEDVKLANVRREEEEEEVGFWVRCCVSRESVAVDQPPMGSWVGSELN